MKFFDRYKSTNLFIWIMFKNKKRWPLQEKILIINVLFGSVLLGMAWKLNLLLKAFTYSNFSVIDHILL